MCYESCEPQLSNIYMRNTNSGSFIVINKYLHKKIKMDTQTVSQLINDEGSIQDMYLDAHTKNVFKTASEISQKKLIDMYAKRQRFIDQSQSMNLFQDKPDYDKVTSCLIYGFRQKLKTGLYYLRQKPAVDQHKFQHKFNNAP